MKNVFKQVILKLAKWSLPWIVTRIMLLKLRPGVSVVRIGQTDLLRTLQPSKG